MAVATSEDTTTVTEVEASPKTGTIISSSSSILAAATEEAPAATPPADARGLTTIRAAATTRTTSQLVPGTSTTPETPIHTRTATMRTAMSKTMCRVVYTPEHRATISKWATKLSSTLTNRSIGWSTSITRRRRMLCLLNPSTGSSTSSRSINSCTIKTSRDSQPSPPLLALYTAAQTLWLQNTLPSIVES